MTQIIENGRRPRRHKFKNLKQRAANYSANATRKLVPSFELSIHVGNENGNENRNDLSASDPLLKASFFQTSILREQDADKSDQFCRFASVVEPYIQSLPLILHNLSKIVSEWEASLQNSIVKTTFLRVIVDLAKDVSYELYKYLGGILEKVLANIGTATDLELCQKSLECVGALLHELNGVIVDKDPNLLLLRPFYGDLLGNRRDFIRRFAGEALGPLFRQLPSECLSRQLKILVKKFAGGDENIERSERERLEVADGVAQLAFNGMRNVQHRLHSRADEFLTAFFACLTNKENDSCNFDSIDERVRCLQRMVCLTVEFVNIETAQDFWTLFLPHFRDPGSNYSAHTFGCLLRTLKTAFAYRSFSRTPSEIDKSILAILKTGVLGKRSEKESNVWWETSSSESDRRIVAKETFQILALLCKRPTNNDEGNSTDTTDLIVGTFALPSVRQDPLPLIKQVVSSLADPILLCKSILNMLVVQIESDLVAFLKKQKKHSLPAGVLAMLESLAYIARYFDHVRVLEGTGRIPLPKRAFNFVLRAIKGDFDDKLSQSMTTPQFYCCVLDCLGLYEFDYSRLEPDLINLAKRCIPNNVTTVCPLWAKAHETAILLSFSRSEKISMDSSFGLKELFVHFLENFAIFSRCGPVMDAFSKILSQTGECFPKELKTKLIDSHKEKLIHNLIDPRHRLRVASLKLLITLMPCESPRQRSSTDSEVREAELKASGDVMDLLLELEQAPLEYGQEKNRERLISSISGSIRLKRIPASYLGIVAAGLVGQLHVPYSPMWKHIVETLGIFSQLHFRDHLWPIFWKHLRFVCSLSSSTKSVDLISNSVFVTEEDEFAKTDGNGKLSGILRSRSTQAMDLFKETYKAASSFGKRIESVAFDEVLLLFFTFLRDEYYACEGRIDDMDIPGPETDENLLLSQQGSAEPFTVSSGMSRHETTEKLVCWLRLFSQFRKLKVSANGSEISAAAVLKRILIRFLIKSESEVSKLSLQCLKLFEIPYFEDVYEDLESMLDEKRYKATLTSFKIEDLSLEARSTLMPIIVRLLFSRILTRKRRSTSDGENKSSKRASVLAFFSRLTNTQELYPLFEVLFRPFCTGIDFSVDDPEVSIEMVQIEKVPLSRFDGWVKTLAEVVKELGTCCLPYMDRILTVLFAFLKPRGDDTKMDIDESSIIDENCEKTGEKALKLQLRNEAIRRISEIILLFPDFELTKWTKNFAASIKVGIPTLNSTVINQTKPSALLSLSHALAQTEKIANWAFVVACPDFLPAIILCLGSGVDSGRGPGPAIVSLIYDILEKLLSYESMYNAAVVPHIPLLLEMLLIRFKGSSKSLHSTEQARRSQSFRELRILLAVSQHFRQTLESDDIGIKKQNDDVHKVQDTCEKLVDLLAEFLPLRTLHGFGSGKAHFVSKRSSSAISGGKVRTRNEYSIASVDNRAELLSAISGLLSNCAQKEGYIAKFSRFLGVNGIDPVFDMNVRNELLQLFDRLRELESLSSTLEPVVPLLQNLNTWSQTKIGMMDFETRLGAYEVLENKCGAFTVVQLLPFAHQALLDLYEDDFPIRSAAQNFLQTGFLSSHSAVRKSLSQIILPVLMPGIRCGLKSSDIQIRRMFMMLLRQASAVAPSLDDNIDWGEIDMERANALMFADLHHLVNNEDPEKDFFTSISHVQSYRQSRYLAYLRECLRSCKVTLGSSTLVHVVLPLTLHILTESSKEKDAHMKEEGALMVGQIGLLLPWTHYLNLIKYLMSTADKNAELEKRMLKAACMVIDNYHFPSNEVKLERTLRDNIAPLFEKKLIGAKHVGSQKTMIRISVAVAIVKILKRLPEGELSRRLPRLLYTIIRVAKSLDRDAREEARITLVSVAKELGPEYFGLIVEKIKSTLSEGYQLHLRGYTLHALLEGTAQMHMESLEMQRKNLGQPIPRKGIEELPSVEETHQNEPDIDNSTNILSEETLDIEVCGSRLDAIIPDFIAVVEDELFGDLAEQKNPDSGYRSRLDHLVEAHKSRSYDTLELLARLIAFLPARSIHELLRPLVTRVESSTDMKELRTVEEWLRRVGIGLTKNIDLRIPHLLVYIHHVISSEYESIPYRAQGKSEGSMDSLVTSDTQSQGASVFSNWIVKESASETARARKLVRARNAYANVHIVEAEPQMTGRDRFDAKKSRDSKRNKASISRSNRHIIVEHALDLLLGAFRSHRLSKTVESHRGMLDPFVELLSKVCVGTKASRSAVLSLRALSVLIGWKLPAAEAYVPSIVNSIMSMISEVGFTSTSAAGGGSSSSLTTSFQSTAVDTAQECVKLLILILRSCLTYEFSSAHVQTMVKLAQHNIGLSERQQTTLSLIRAIVERHFVVTEIYDLMSTLSEMLFNANNGNVRHVCGQILVAFFIHYPLSSKRLRQHLDLIVANMDYEHEAGRQAGLTALNSIVSKFPPESLDDISKAIFLPLVVRVANEDSLDCRRILNNIFKSLFIRSPPSTFRYLFGLVDVWLQADVHETAPNSNSIQSQWMLQRAGIQIIGFLAEARTDLISANGWAHKLVKQLCHIISRDILKSRDSTVWAQHYLALEEKFGEGEGWRTVYHSLTTLRKLLLNCKSLGSCEDVLCTDQQFLHDKHENETDSSWSIMSKLILPLAARHPHIHPRTIALFIIGQCFSCISPDTATSPARSGRDFSTKPMIFLVASLHARMIDFESIDEAAMDQTVKNLVWIISALIVIEPNAGLEGVDVSGSGDEMVDADESDAKSENNQRSLNWLIHRLSYIARYKGAKRDNHERADARQCAVFKLFAFLTTKWSDSPMKLDAFLLPILSPMIHVVNQQKVSGITFKAPDLARECLEMIEQAVGTTKFVKVYASVQKTIDERKDARRRDRLLEKVNNPQESGIKRKSRREQQKRAKVRKIARFRRMEGR